MRTTLLKQIVDRRKRLKIRPSDMPLLAGINRQQYVKIEKAGNPSLETLDKIAEGLEAELMLIPKERLAAVKRALHDERDNLADEQQAATRMSEGYDSPRADDKVIDPWALIEGSNP
jgi:transcriptional regulator with XRE-family HTH domain